MKDNPIEIDDKIFNSDFLDTEMDEITGTAISIQHLTVLPDQHYNFAMLARYCPQRNGNVLTSVVATGRIGVWRTHNFELDKCDDNVEKCLETE